MTKMKSKQPEQRRTRRRRYIEAIDPFRKKYEVPAGKVFEVIQGIENENRILKAKVLEQNVEIDSLKEQVKSLKAGIETSK